MAGSEHSSYYPQNDQHNAVGRIVGEGALPIAEQVAAKSPQRSGVELLSQVYATLLTVVNRSASP